MTKKEKRLVKKIGKLTRYLVPLLFSLPFDDTHTHIYNSPKKFGFFCKNPNVFTQVFELYNVHFDAIEGLL